MSRFCLGIKNATNIISRMLYQRRFLLKRTKSEEPTLYGDVASPPVRFVMITASLVGVKLKFHNIDLFKSENKSDFYKQINPLQKVPVLAIDDEFICDSHAIALYLCETNEKQKLYPKEGNISKARVDEMIFYNATTLFPLDSAIYTDYFTEKWADVETNEIKWYECLDHLEERLNQYGWLSGDKMYISDICCAMTVSSLSLLIPTPDRYENIKNWTQRLEEVPSFKEINNIGLDRLRGFVESTPNLHD